MELGQEITAEDVVLDTRYGGPEYGLPNEGTLEAIRLCARQEGMLTDPVYEGKSMHGMIDRVRRGELPEALACCMRTWEGCRRSTPTAFFFATADDTAAAGDAMARITGLSLI